MTINNKTVLAIVPARAGSRRVPLKNLQLYTNKSTGLTLALIEWAIRQAKFSEYIDTIAISSDSDEILNYAKPPIIPIRRPAYLASDSASSEAVLVHAVYSSTTLGEPYIPFHDYLVLLQPTSPLRTPNDIDSALELAEHRHGRAVSVNEAGARNGAVYVAKTELFLAKLDLEAPGAHYSMPNSRSLDIDEREDFGK